MPTLRERRAVCNPSSSEVHSDVADVLAEVVKKRASVQSLFLPESRGRRRGRRWTWGGGEPVSPPPGKHTTNAQPMQTSRTVRLRKAQHQNIPNCVRLTTQTVMRQSTVFRCIKTPRTVRQENSHLHMLSRPQCACILGDHQDWMALRQAK